MRWFENFPHERMHRWLDAVRESGGLILATSKGESFGLSVAEAMARSCAVVVPAEPPFSEFIEHDREGKLFRAGSAKSAAVAAEQLLIDAELRTSCGTWARRRILKQHRLEPAMEKWKEALTQLEPAAALH